VPRTWRIRVQRLPRYGLPVIRVWLDGLYNAGMVLSSGEPSTVLAPLVAEDLRRFAGRELGRGRRVIAGDAAPLIVPLQRVRSLEIRDADGDVLRLGPIVAAISPRAQVLGAGGILGVDLLSRFARATFEADPPDWLILEERS
jgi:hypothetical protein